MEPAVPIAPRFEDFREVERLPLEAARSLLREGDPPERVWAAWVLGLRLGPEARRELEEALRAEVDPGVRAHLVVVLAGFGGRALLEVLAARERHPDVRATAAGCLARLVRPADRQAVEVLVRLLRDDPSPAVRAAAVRGLGPEPPPALEQACAARLEDPDPEVRQAAFEHLLEWTPPGGPFPSVLERRLDEEPDAILRRLFLSLRAARPDGGPALLARAASHPGLVAREALEVLLRRGRPQRWEHLEPLARKGDPALAPLVVRLLGSAPPAEARPWLEELVQRAAALARPFEELFEQGAAQAREPWPGEETWPLFEAARLAERLLDPHPSRGS